MSQQLKNKLQNTIKICINLLPKGSTENPCIRTDDTFNIYCNHICLFELILNRLFLNTNGPLLLVTTYAGLIF